MVFSFSIDHLSMVIVMLSNGSRTKPIDALVDSSGTKFSAPVAYLIELKT